MLMEKRKSGTLGNVAMEHVFSTKDKETSEMISLSLSLCSFLIALSAFTVRVRK